MSAAASTSQAAQTISNASASEQQPPTTLPTWPPKLTPNQLQHLLTLSTTYALAHGFTLLPPAPTFPPTSTVAAPLSLFPTPFPRALYQLARELQPLYNALYARIALDWEFLDGVFAGVSEVDAFQGALWRGWTSVRKELSQPLQLGIFRSDYLLHDTPGKPLEIKQVEFNTIASSFGALSQRAGEMHQYLSRSTGGYFGSSPHFADAAAYPSNHSLEQVAAGLGDAWEHYDERNAAVLFVVQDGERNVFDQRWLEYELMEKNPGLRVIRHTFAELETLATVDPDTKRLLLPSPEDPSAPPIEVAVIYYRAAYTPNDYTTGKEWNTRLLLERSRAIKCPSMALQLAGAKKVQQVLSEPGVLEDFLLGPDRPDVGLGRGAGSVSQADVDRLRETWIGLYPLDDSEQGKAAVRLAKTESERFVLKPQREGGGNNIYRESIPPFLAELEKSGKDSVSAYILMELITPPKDLHNLLLKGGEATPRDADVVSELGVYGVMLFHSQAGSLVNREAGTLLRTKGRESDEGGVAIGISSIDSPLLVV